MRKIMNTVEIGINMNDKDWYIIDAEQAVLGRLASKIATLLKGKHKPTYLPHEDNGDYVVVVNAKNLNVTGNKLEDKVYYKHTGYPGGGSEISLAELRRSKPDRILKSAIKGMLPHNRLGRSILTQLKIYSGGQHPHSAQQPQLLEI